MNHVGEFLLSFGPHILEVDVFSQLLSPVYGNGSLVLWKTNAHKAQDRFAYNHTESRRAQVAGSQSQHVWEAGKSLGSDATRPELNAGDATHHLCDLIQLT